MKYDVVDINYNANDLVGIVGDKTIHLSGYVSEKKYPEDLRLIEFYDAEKDEIITFITNNFELGSLIIANIYRNRWQIETFFKWIKGNLTIKALWGYSENAVKIHLWVAISTYLLLAWVKAELKLQRSLRSLEHHSLPRERSENSSMFLNRSLKIKMSMNFNWIFKQNLSHQ